jgi:NAD(P)-dependent dehydrogenase (short-subunit alcohol dehydrogenase family)
VNVNLRGVFFASQYAARQMIAQGGGGRIITISSMPLDWPIPMARMAQPQEIARVVAFLQSNPGL